MRQALENPFYYLENFRQVLAWVSRHHRDLLDETELAFIERFALLPQPSQALLVRMVMRKGMLFRASKLRYPEIGCSRRAVEPLIDQGVGRYVFGPDARAAVRFADQRRAAAGVRVVCISQPAQGRAAG